MAAEAVNAAVSSASSASETVRLGVIAGEARDRAFQNAVDNGKSGADALNIANAVAKGYADAAKASASAAKKAQETAQSASNLAAWLKMVKLPKTNLTNLHWKFRKLFRLRTSLSMKQKSTL